MLKLVLNGFFRSGTTVLWKIIRESNPNMYVFCEPLHNELFSSIYREQTLKEMSHGYSTTDEYVKQGDCFLKRLRESHPAINGDMVYSYSINNVANYLKIFNSLDAPSVIQPNRLHFILSDLAEIFSCKIVHIIRHPLDVFLSVMFSSPKLKKIRNLYGINPYLLRLFKNKNPYFLDQQCEFISHYFGIALPRMNPLVKYVFSKKFYLQKFILAWTIANWHAVLEVDKAKGLIIRYEDFNDKNMLNVLSEFGEIIIDSSKVKIHERAIGKFRSQDFSICHKIAKDIGIHKEFKALADRFNYSI